MIKCEMGRCEITGKDSVVKFELETIFRALRECADFKDSDFEEVLENSKKSKKIERNIKENISDEELASVIKEILNDIKDMRNKKEI